MAEIRFLEVELVAIMRLPGATTTLSADILSFFSCPPSCSIHFSSVKTNDTSQTALPSQLRGSACLVGALPPKKNHCGYVNALEVGCTPDNHTNGVPSLGTPRSEWSLAPREGRARETGLQGLPTRCYCASTFRKYL